MVIGWGGEGGDANARGLSILWTMDDDVHGREYLFSKGVINDEGHWAWISFFVILDFVGFNYFMKSNLFIYRVVFSIL